jgi:hypothetical protein
MDWKLALIDLTTSTTPADLKPTQVFGDLMVASLELSGYFAQLTGITVNLSIRVASSPDDRQPGELACNFRDTLDVQGALAYHQVVNGLPDVEVGVDLFTGLTDGDEPLTVGFTHELLEMLGDPGANEWADKQDGSGLMCAKEFCDLVQNTNFAAKNGIPVTNFVLPAYFIPGSIGPYDYLNAVKDPKDTSHGYEIQAPSPTDVTQVAGLSGLPHTRMAGSLTDVQRKRKSHPLSRTSRRGLNLYP